VTTTDESVRSERPRGRLRRELGALEVTASGVGIIIGAGIYVLLGAAAAEAGAAVWASFAIAALLCALTGLSYAELASMYPKAGAEFEYTRQAFSPRVAFVVGWTMSLGLMVAAAAIAVGFAHYVRYFVNIPIVPVAISLLIVEAAFAARGILASSRLTLLLSGIQVAGLLFVIVVGLPHLGERSLTAGAGAGGVLGGAALVFFAFIGFDEVITLSEETEQPTRVIPRALLGALAISTVLYMAVAISATSVLGAAGLANSSTPLADVMSEVLGGRAEGAVAAVALLSTVNTSLLAMTAGSRLLYGMADSGALPVWVARVSVTGAPVVSLVLVAGGAVIFASIGDVGFVAGVTDVAVYVVFLAVNATLIRLRFSEATVPRPFRVPLSIGRLPLLPIAGLAGAGLMIPQLSPSSLLAGAALVGAGAVVHAALGRRGGEQDGRTR
jgi:basic amino acid/polyamine antiporter, APA family